MKRILIITSAIAALASCAKVSVVDPTTSTEGSPIMFSVAQKNMTKASTALSATGHYNFGVFAYKDIDATHNIMENYLVGYMDESAKKGYYMTQANQSTLGDAEGNANRQSMWAYEKLGNAEYTYTGTDGYYKSSETAYTSNLANQYLRYWDYASASTTFYAYAPYVHGTGTATYDNSTKVLTIPDGTIVDGYDNPTDLEFMYAKTTVAKASYGNDVPLNFVRLNAKVNIRFYEDISGYSVQILDLTSTSEGISVVPAIRTGSAAPYSYAKGKYYSKTGVSIDFSGSTPAVTQAAGTTSQASLSFAAPAATEIGTDANTASASATTYYAIPKNLASDTDTYSTGFTFHVTYKLTSTTGETLTVNDATVYVPAEYTCWTAGTAYTYVFKITKNTNGSTDPGTTIDPDSPAVPDNKALFPIVFDDCLVADWNTPTPADTGITM